MSSGQRKAFLVGGGSCGGFVGIAFDDGDVLPIPHDSEVSIKRVANGPYRIGLEVFVDVLTVDRRPMLEGLGGDQDAM